MKKNVGRTDRILRIVFGAAMVLKGVFLFTNDATTWVVTIIGAGLLITGILGFCPLYVLLRINTNK